jgi:hypothetical protein
MASSGGSGRGDSIPNTVFVRTTRLPNREPRDQIGLSPGRRKRRCEEGCEESGKIAVVPYLSIS